MGVARRIAASLLVIWAAASVAFILEEVLPGDPARMVAGLQARPSDVARIREQLGLNRRPIVRYAIFWSHLVHIGPNEEAGAQSTHANCRTLVPMGKIALHIDLGESFQQRAPVAALIAARVPRTFALACAGLFVQLLAGVGGGTLAAARRGSTLDRLLLGGSLLGVGAPTFLVALLLQTVLARQLRWLPVDGYGRSLQEHVRCLVMPAITLGIYGAAFYTRLVRDELSTLLNSDWARTARAKGATRTRALVRHGLRNTLVPIVTSAGLDLGTLMGGTIVIESIFRWPGLGLLSMDAVLNRDGPVLTGCLLVMSFAVVTANLAVDILCPLLDPRLSVEPSRDNG